MTNLDRGPDGKLHGASKITAVPVKKSGIGWLMWLLGALALVALGLLLLRQCVHRTAPVANTAATATSTPPVAVEMITLPGGKTISLAPDTLNYELQRYLGSAEAAPRRFTFDNLNFSTNSAELPPDATETVNALAQILAAYPKAKVALQGYADSTGPDPHNVQLGSARAEAVAKALVAQGVDAGRVSTLTGGSSNPVDTNATPQGRAENRRTELVVTAK